MSSAARCLFPSQSPKQQPSVPITAREAPLMTIRNHLQMLQLTPVILLSFSVNYTNHFLQDGSPGCQPRIYHSHICACWIHEQVNQVSCDLIQVAWIQMTSWVPARRACSTSTCQAGVSPPPIFSSFTPHPVCLPLRCVFQCSS